MPRLLILVALLVVAASLLVTGSAEARPAWTYGVGCMETAHAHFGTPGPADDEHVSVDPRGLMQTPTPPWRAQYQRYDTRIPDWETTWYDAVDVDSVVCCPGASICSDDGGLVTTWAYQTAVMPLEIFTAVHWRLTIDSGCAGYGCSTETEWPVLSDIDATGNDATGTTSCDAGGEADFIVHVPH